MAAAHRTEAARAAVAAFERQFPASPRTPLLRAALMLHEGKVREVFQVLYRQGRNIERMKIFANYLGDWSGSWRDILVAMLCWGRGEWNNDGHAGTATQRQAPHAITL